MIKTLFLGSNYEALETLRALHESPSFDVVGVITQPDKPVGRKQEIMPTEVKQYCLEKDIDVIHTENCAEKYQQVLNILRPELIVCKSFGEIIPSFVLDYPKYGAINVHFSLLPKYRGAVPIQKAILDGEKETGITIIKMSPKIDEGGILNTQKEIILDSDTNDSLRRRLVKKVPEFLLSTLEQWISGDIKAIPQNLEDATFCCKQDISKEKGMISWEDETAEYIDRKIRAFLPWPVAWTIINGKKTKIYEASIIPNMTLAPGAFSTDAKNVFVGCKLGVIGIKKIQIEGKKPMTASEFLNGYKVVSIQ